MTLRWTVSSSNVITKLTLVLIHAYCAIICRADQKVLVSVPNYCGYPSLPLNGTSRPMWVCE